MFFTSPCTVSYDAIVLISCHQVLTLSAEDPKQTLRMRNQRPWAYLFGSCMADKHG